MSPCVCGTAVCVPSVWFATPSAPLRWAWMNEMSRCRSLIGNAASMCASRLGGGASAKTAVHQRQRQRERCTHTRTHACTHTPTRTRQVHRAVRARCIQNVEDMLEGRGPRIPVGEGWRGVHAEENARGGGNAGEVVLRRVGRLLRLRGRRDYRALLDPRRHQHGGDAHAQAIVVKIWSVVVVVGGCASVGSVRAWCVCLRGGQFGRPSSMSVGNRPL